jgi:hypothetical protein
MPAPIIPLVEVFVEIPDFRKRRGKRHPLPAILALACAAVRCGARSYSALADWGRNYGQALAQALGFSHVKTPCAATLHTVFRQLDDVALFESKLRQWAEQVLVAYALGRLTMKPAPLTARRCGVARSKAHPAPTCSRHWRSRP